MDQLKLVEDSLLKNEKNVWSNEGNIGNIIKKLPKTLLRDSLVTIISHSWDLTFTLHYGDIIYDQPNNESLNKKIDLLMRIWCNAATIGAAKRTFQSKFYIELGFESPKFRSSWRWFRKLCTFYKNSWSTRISTWYYS